MAYTRTATLERLLEVKNNIDIKKFLLDTKQYAQDIFESFKSKITSWGTSVEITEGEQIPSYDEQKIKHKEQEKSIYIWELNNDLSAFKEFLNNNSITNKDTLIGDYILKLYKTVSKWDSKRLKELFWNLRMQIKPKNGSENMIKINDIQDLYDLKGEIVKYTTKTTWKTADARILDVEYDNNFKWYVVQLEKIKDNDHKHIFDTFTTWFKPWKDFFNDVNFYIHKEEIKKPEAKKVKIDRDEVVYKAEEIISQDVNPKDNIIHFHPKNSEKMKKAI